jgi:hypothetical protein
MVGWWARMDLCSKSAHLKSIFWPVSSLKLLPTL